MNPIFYGKNDLLGWLTVSNEEFAAIIKMRDELVHVAGYVGLEGLLPHEVESMWVGENC